MEPDRDQREAQRRRRLEEQVAPHKKWLVERGDKIGKLAGGNAEWASQARGLLEAARAESEPLVLLNLLRYQSARNKNWRDPEDVFTPLLQDFESCITKGQGAENPEELVLELIRHLLVYTIRAHAFHRRAKKASAAVEDES